MISAPTGQALVENIIIYNVDSSKALREDARSDENNAFMSEDSTKVRRANKGVGSNRRSAACGR